MYIRTFRKQVWFLLFKSRASIVLINGVIEIFRIFQTRRKDVRMYGLTMLMSFSQIYSLFSFV